jgi:Flp pilus assembly protein TadG
MRMKALNRIHCEERGGVVAIVAILSTLFLSLAALSVDFGVMFAKRRAIVNAADAAALAAALSCALGDGQGTADAEADSLAVANSADAAAAVAAVYDPSCDAPSGSVTVRYGTDQGMIFAPIIGVDEMRVETSSRAVWGAAGGASKVSPLMLNAHRLSSCDVPFGVEEGDTCSFWWNNSPANNPNAEEDLANAEWGTMDLNNWGVPPTVHCNNSTPPEFERWLNEGYPGSLELKDPPPTLTCRGQGNFGARLTLLIQAQVGETLYFPVNDPDQQVDANGNLCPPNSTNNCLVDKYAIVGFAVLEVTAIYRGNTPQGLLACPGHLPDANARCLVATWRGFQTGGIVSGGSNFGLIAIGLGG